MNLRTFSIPFLLGCFIIIQMNTYGSTEELNVQYIHHCTIPSDINEHVPVLKRLSQECECVTEIGVREAVSTWGILKGLSENNKIKKGYLGIDLCYPSCLLQLSSIAEGATVDFDFWKVNDMEIDIPETDMLFIDSLHTYCHLTYELETFSPKVRKYIAMHDTSAPWGNQDDDAYHGNYSEYPEHINKQKRGLWPAVEDFLSSHPEWKLNERKLNNHGFTILERVK